MTQEQVKALFDYDGATGTLIWKAGPLVKRNKGKIAGTTTKAHHHVRIKVAGQMWMAHRLIYLWHHGHIPAVLDHADRNPRNNRIQNIRPVTLNQNAWNATKYKTATSKWKGVTKHKQNDKWVAFICTNYVKQYLGSFDSEEDAAMAWNAAALEQQGEFAVLNESPLNHISIESLLDS